MPETPIVPTAGRTTLTLLAPISGVIVPLDDVPDPVFAQRLAGDGISIDPLSEQVVAPCDAIVRQVHRAGHAVTLEADGLEIVIHVGLDTVLLQGDGFHPAVKAGARVHAGDVLLRFDLDAVSRKARSLLTEILIANVDRVAALRPRSGVVTAGRDVLLEIDLAGTASEEASPTAVSATSSVITSPPTVVASRTGLHARPAALVASTARHFAADLRLQKGDRDANARSVVSVMALEVGGGDLITVVGRGVDATEAVAAIVALLATDLDAGTDNAATPSMPNATATLTSARASSPNAAPTVQETTADGTGILRGVAASPGVAVGHIFHLRHDDAVVEERGAEPAQEQRALDSAIAAAHLQLEGLRQRLTAEADAEHAAIFGAHQALLEDPEVIDRAAANVRDGASAPFAWRQSYTSQ
ncbi:MAG: glucose PTS transporter subunit IIA, partial [Gemmatimonadaceae bacterium]